MTTYQQGEKVGFLSEKGGGTVIDVLPGNLYLVLDNDGFERKCLSKELVKIYSTEFNLPENESSHLDEEGQIVKKTHVRNKERSQTSSRGQEFWEIDLHIESLVESHAGMNNSQILEHQMREFRQFYQNALNHRIRKLIIIHGVGEGILKHEIREFLAGKTGISFYDADFRMYGKGATAIEVRYTQIDS